MNSSDELSDRARLLRWPWPYVQLDPEPVRRRAYELCYAQDNCMYGSAAALLLALEEKIGFPYSALPKDMFRYGAGGGAGVGALCGALNGAGAIINLVAQDYFSLFARLVQWYCETPLPSERHKAYCLFPSQPATVAGSPLCSVSLFNWGMAAGEPIRGDAQRDRCAKLVGDTAAMAVLLLNDALCARQK